jgi:putative ABC transport system permease protein
MKVPLKFAQSLLDTNSVDRLAVLLDDGGKSDTMKPALTREFAQRKLEVEIRTWKELDPMYEKARDMFDIIFLFIFLIVFVIVVMSVINTMSMAVMERTREIGTLRALGVKRKGIVSLFAIESAMLGIVGCILGVGSTLASWLIINVAVKPTWVPPIVTTSVPLEIYLVPEYMLYSTVFLVVLSIGAAISPATKATRQEIVVALGHV